MEVLARKKSKKVCTGSRVREKNGITTNMSKHFMRFNVNSTDEMQ